MRDHVWQDVSFGLRALVKRPGFTLLAVLTLVLGIGANTAMFSIVNALILRPYSFPELDRLVLVREGNRSDASRQGRLAPADAVDLSRAAGIFETTTAYRFQELNLTSEGEVRPVLGCAASAGFFDVLRARPALGRTFLPDEDQAGRGDVVVLSDTIWRRLGADPGLLGRSLRLDGRPRTVVGIMPPAFDYPVPVELWMPLALGPDERADRARRSLYLLGRLRSDARVEQARAALTALGRRLEQQHPETRAGRTVTVVRLREEFYPFTLPLFLTLQGAAGFLLFLCGANLMNLLLARLVARRRELAIRTALGASRAGLVRLMLAESVAFSVLAGSVAAAVSVVTVDVVRTSISAEYTKWVPGWDRVRVDGTVLAFTLALAGLLGVAFGVASAWHSAGLDLSATLKQGGAATTDRSPRSRLRAALVVGQVALAMVLLVGAGLMMNGFRRLAILYQGFEPASVLTFQIAVPEARYAEGVRLVSFQDELLRRLGGLPGVRSVGVVANLPASNVENPWMPFTIEGRPTLKASEAPVADVQVASGDLFRTLAIPLLDGRTFREDDGPAAPPVVAISKGLAGRFWPGSSPLGQRLKLGSPDSDRPWATVVGVVGDVKQNWWDPQPRPVIYLPHRQSPRRSMAVAVRTQSDPLAPLPLIRAAVQAIDPEVGVRDAQPMDGLVDDSLAVVRVMGVLMAAFGGVALALSALGIYGVMSHAVAQRTQELGMRMALGASPRNLLGLVLGQALRLCGLGLVLGVPVAFAMSHALASLVFGVVSVEPAVLVGLAAGLLLVGLAAGFVPAWRATRGDPLLALRHE